MAESKAVEQGSAASLETDVIPSRDRTFRIVIAHKDEDHPNATEFAWRRVFVVNPDFHGPEYDPLADAKSQLKQAREEYPTAEGYEHRIQVLAPAGPDSHEWQEV